MIWFGIFRGCEWFSCVLLMCGCVVTGILCCDGVLRVSWVVWLDLRGGVYCRFGSWVLMLIADFGDFAGGIPCSGWVAGALGCFVALAQVVLCVFLVVAVLCGVGIIQILWVCG